MKRINLIDTAVLKDGRYLAPMLADGRWGLYEPDGRLVQQLSLYEGRLVDSALQACRPDWRMCGAGMLLGLLIAGVYGVLA